LGQLEKIEGAAGGTSLHKSLWVATPAEFRTERMGFEKTVKHVASVDTMTTAFFIGLIFAWFASFVVAAISYF
jgi:hypothetical protein